MYNVNFSLSEKIVLKISINTTNIHATNYPILYQQDTTAFPKSILKENENLC